MQQFIPGQFYCYFYQNKINGKMYVGKGTKYRWMHHIAAHQTEGSKVRDEFRHFYGALRKYGMENFEYGIFAYYNSEEEAYIAEAYWIDRLKQFGVELYNLSSGGVGSNTGTKMPRESVERRAQKMGGRKFSEEHREKISKAMVGNTNGLGRKKGDEEIRKMAVSMRGQDRVSKRKFSLEIEKAICEAYAQGSSTDMLAKQYECYKSTVRSILIRANIELRGPGSNKRVQANSARRKHSPEQEQEICRLYQEGYTRAELAEQFECGRTTIRDILIRNGVDLKGGKNG